MLQTSSLSKPVICWKTNWQRTRIYPFFCCWAQRVKSEALVSKHTGKHGTLKARDREQREISRGILWAWFGREKLRSQDLSHLICVNHQVWGVMSSWSFTSSLLHSQQDTGLEDYCCIKSCRETNEQHCPSPLRADPFFTGTVGGEQFILCFLMNFRERSHRYLQYSSVVILYSSGFEEISFFLKHGITWVSRMFYKVLL